MEHKMADQMVYLWASQLADLRASQLEKQMVDSRGLLTAHLTGNLMEWQRVFRSEPPSELLMEPTLGPLLVDPMEVHLADLKEYHWAVQ